MSRQDALIEDYLSLREDLRQLFAKILCVMEVWEDYDSAPEHTRQVLAELFYSKEWDSVDRRLQQLHEAIVYSEQPTAASFCYQFDRFFDLFGGTFVAFVEDHPCQLDTGLPPVEVVASGKKLNVTPDHVARTFWFPPVAKRLTALYQTLENSDPALVAADLAKPVVENPRKIRRRIVKKIRDSLPLSDKNPNTKIAELANKDPEIQRLFPDGITAHTVKNDLRPPRDKG